MAENADEPLPPVAVGTYADDQAARPGDDFAVEDHHFNATPGDAEGVAEADGI